MSSVHVYININIYATLKGVAGEGWTVSVGPIVRKNEVLRNIKEERNILRTVERRMTGWVKSCIETAF